MDDNAVLIDPNPNLGPSHYSDGEKAVWNIVPPVIIVVFLMLFFSHRLYRQKCKWCEKRHPQRPPNMTAEEYLRIYCDGWKAYNKMQKVGKGEKLL